MSWTKERALERHCRACDMMYYCSAACEAASNAREHGRLCPFVRRLMVHKADDHTKSLMLLVLLTLHEHALELAGIGGVARTYPIVPVDQPDASAAPASDTAPDVATGAAAADAAQAIAPVETKEPELVLVPSYADVEALQTHLQDWTQEDMDDWRYVLAAAVDIDWWRQRSCSRVVLCDPFLARSKSDRFLVQLIAEAGLSFAELSALRFLSALESNCFGLWVGGSATYGRAVYPSASFFNHDCAPNCESIQQGAGGLMVIVARQPVHAGTELCIKYIDCDVPVSARRQELQRSYHFFCRCERCEAESVSPHRAKFSYARSANHHGARARPHKKAKLAARPAGLAALSDAALDAALSAALVATSINDASLLPQPE